jgi:uncharacterized protein YggU (UPF0235/DUF167 family)
VTGFWRALPDGVSVAVKVQPKARRPGLQGAVPTADGPRLRIAVSEPPEDGRANRAVCAALAEALHVGLSAVRVTAGAAAREKLLFVSGDPAVLGPRLVAL